MIGFLRGLRWLEPIIELLRLGVFGGFVATGLAYVIAPVALRRRRALYVIGYSILVSAVAGASQIESWPFANWTLVHTLRNEEIDSWEMEALDGTGRVWVVDPRILQPLAPEEFGVWMFRNGLTDQVLKFTLERAEQGRRDVLSGHFPPNDRFLGNASAPFHFRQRRLWRTISDVPATPFVSIRVIRLHWNIEQRDRLGDGVIRRTVIAESRR